MPLYLRSTLIILLTIVICETTLRAQACGQGIFTFEIYYYNAEKPADISYKIFPVNIDSTIKLLPKWLSKKMLDQMYFGTKVDTYYIDKVIIAYEKTEKLMCRTNNHNEGMIEKSSLKIETFENEYFPCLLRLNSKTKQLYIIANLFGGCNRTTAVLWNDNPKILGYEH